MQQTAKKLQVTTMKRITEKWKKLSNTHLICTWIQQICRDTGVTATEALQLAEDRPFWRTIATAGGFG